MQLFVGDVTRIPLKNQPVNLAIALLSYHHWSNTQLSFEELQRVLKKGGEFWIYEVNRQLTARNATWMKRYNFVIRKTILSTLKLLKKHSITIEDAEMVAKTKRNGFSDAHVEQLWPLWVKIAFTKV